MNGHARWATSVTPTHATSILDLATRPDSGFALLEIRNVRTSAPATDGVMTRPGGDFILHGVAPAVGADPMPGVHAAFDELLETMAPVDTGRSVGSWMEGATTVTDGLTDDTRNRVAVIANTVDPNHVLARSRHID